ncbi:MAG: ChaN family lipoprotein [Elusimicrobia bacterium]|nr:ChaN family lipoprotein [Elusimicrobiota bacterium]
MFPGFRLFPLMLLALCANARGTEDLSDFKEEVEPLTQYIDRHGRSLNWGEIMAGPEPIIYIGEVHWDVALRKELAAHMDEVKTAGITHVALEMFGDNHQPLLDRYCVDASCRDKVHAALKEGWDYFDESYMAVVDSAREQNIPVLAVDLPAEAYAKMKKRCLESKPPYDFDPAKTRRECTLGMLECKARDCRMADNLSLFLQKNKQARVLVLVGSNHADVTRQPQHLSDLHGLASRSYIAFFDDTVYKRALDLSRWRRQRVLFPLPKEIAHYDGGLRIP